MINRIIGLVGLLIYRVVGIVALPIFLHGSERTRVALIDKKNNQILLGVTWISAQKWNLIGGGIKNGEDVRTAAIREIKEETGLALDAEKLVYVKEQINKTYMASYKTYIYYVYIDEFESKIQRPEMFKLAWFKLDNLPEKIALKTIKPVKDKLNQQG